MAISYTCVVIFLHFYLAYLSSCDFKHDLPKFGVPKVFIIFNFNILQFKPFYVTCTKNDG